ncbi:MAG: tetratricopeptide repeat protein [Deltaproteobacteria bacterium]|nr:tetratricopeptide repeat protein [Deltaproteobacteria bacterium]
MMQDTAGRKARVSAASAAARPTPAHPFALLRAGSSDGRPAGAPALFAILVILFVLTYGRNMVWTDDLTLWRDVLMKSGFKSRPHNSIGVAYAGRRMFDEAASHFKAAIRGGTGAQDIHHYNLGSAYREKGLHAAAATEFKAALGIRDGYTEARYSLSVTYRELGLMEAAGIELARLILQSPDNDIYHNDLGNIRLMQKQYRLAMDEYKETLRLNPGNVEAAYNLAISYDGIGEKDEAIKYYRAFLKAAPPEYDALKADIRQRLIEPDPVKGQEKGERRHGKGRDKDK